VKPFRSRFRTWCVATVALALTAGVAAWTYTGRAGPDAPATGEATGEDSGPYRQLPFFQLLYVPSESRSLIRSTEERLTIACMASRGFRYEPAPDGAPAASTSRPMPFGLESLRTPPEPDQPPAEERQGTAFMRALHGDPNKRIRAKGRYVQVSRPANGCLAEAEERLLGDDRLRWLEVRIHVADGEREAREQLEGDAVFREANERWRQCMHRRGFEQNDPVSLLSGIPRGTVLRNHFAARADIRCKGDTDYLTTAYARLAVAQSTWLDQHAALLAEWRSLLAKQAQAAGAVR